MDGNKEQTMKINNTSQ